MTTREAERNQEATVYLVRSPLLLRKTWLMQIVDNDDRETSMNDVTMRLSGS